MFFPHLRQVVTPVVVTVHAPPINPGIAGVGIELPVFWNYPHVPHITSSSQYGYHGPVFSPSSYCRLQLLNALSNLPGYI
ncbi:hypothetical protein [Bacillus cereus]|uniref:Uncharacterized protein n=1 Tax=Bacillus cereus HuA4-10 TaxID=1053206 RepID=J8AE84_BACCE|nr:hypothetical protein [Bacillus cereus]EJQ79943.1 hypothetical protein IGC_02514 [Bacillus cereus HuA4-10]